MQFANWLIDRLTELVRSPMRLLARWLNKLSRGRLNPHSVTLVSLLMHVPTALLIATRHYLWAAPLLLVFGLLDAVDGELARLQQRDTPTGMLLDSVTDRMKEIVLYTGIAWALVATYHSYAVVWAVVACGSSLLVSYSNAWGEVLVARHQGSTQLNQTFRSGLMRYQVRMLAILIGLLSGQLLVATAIVAVLAWYTAIERLVIVARRLT